MAWHILHGLLEQVRVQSTFPGKLWIIVMFIFRIVVVARIGDNVYHDEQANFVCNVLTPGCENVCFNRFSPISQLRYWSLMILVVSTPAILFFLYATHIIYHAGIKYPSEEDEEKKEIMTTRSDQSYIHPPSLKRRRDEGFLPNGTTGPLFEVKKIGNSDGKYKTAKFGNNRRSDDIRRRRHVIRHDGDVKRKLSTDNNESNEEVYIDYRNKVPIFVDPHGQRVEFMKEVHRNRAEDDAMAERKFRKRMLEHPELYRAYWWHVFLRTLCEVGFLVGQYYLYGWSVHELYECNYWPCPKTVDCFVSRPQEKTCLLWLMYVLGIIACLLSVAEFWTLGITRLKYAFLCCSHDESREERRRRLALLETHSTHHDKENDPLHPRLITGAMSFDSLSSETTVESV
uniref:Gap junction protein n=1 Tax=Halocynthia pyriformis TaxID=247438 RepID=Q6U1M0_9ASCI|nr:connexin47 [Halocynthia pyriformis]